jgi:FAD:protein FMN transferase
MTFTSFFANLHRRGLLTVLLMSGATLMLLVGCGRVETTFTGGAMSTTYMVKVVAKRSTKTRHLKTLIDQRLDAVSASMSTYRPGSELSRFNDQHKAGAPFTPSKDFLAVMRVAAKIYTATSGAWDGTLDPLITLWGFGRDNGRDPQEGHHVPPTAEIEALLPRVGFDHITITSQGRLIKKDGLLTLDLASIAKGYGVDAIARLLARQGYSDYMVEVGGEIFAAGHRLDGKPWRVGVNRPDRKAGFSEVYKVVDLSDKGFATSGDYRNYFEAGGRYYSHILDPHTGYPITNGVVSASVMADTCTLADGLATALMVMGPDAGLALVETLPHVEALIIVRQADGGLEEHASKGFPAEKE